MRGAQKVDGAGGEEFLREAKQVDRHPEPTLIISWVVLGKWHLQVGEQEPGEGCDTDCCAL